MTNTPDHTDKTATEFIEINGVHLAYSQTGSRPLAIYAHGLTLSWASDRRLGLLDFSLIATDHHLIAYDARGHGESGASANPADYAWPPWLTTCWNWPITSLPICWPRRSVLQWAQAPSCMLWSKPPIVSSSSR
jgi:pimeloyl-ACP methyl ester carboxylesterase